MKIAFLQGTLENGGAEIMTRELTKALKREKNDVSIISLRAVGDLKKDYDALKIPVYAGLLKYKFDVFALRRLRRLLSALALDMLIIVDPLKNSLSMLGTVFRVMKNRPATLLWSHSIPGGQMGQYVPRVQKALKKWLDEIVCISVAQKEILMQMGISSTKLKVVNNGIQIDKFKKCALKLDSKKNISDQAFKFIQVANVMPDKDFETLFAACKLLQEDQLNFELTLVGRGTDSAEIYNQIPADLKVNCLGARSDISNLLANADGFVLASKSEVQSVSTLEAMVAGLPVVVPNLPGFYEICTDNFDCLKYKVSDPHDLSLKMQKLITDPKIANDLAINAVKSGLKFSADKMCHKFIDIICKNER